jgi:hypothetical protein
VIDEQYDLAKVGLARAVGNAGEEIDDGVHDEVREPLAIIAKRAHAAFPGVRAPGSGGRGPVLGHRRFAVGRIDAEIENIALRPAQVLDELPRRMRKGRCGRTSSAHRDAIHCRVEADVGILPRQQPAQVLAERCIRVHRSLSGRMV